MKTIYLSPSTQKDNIGAGIYGSEEKRMNQIADVTERVLKAHGLTVYRNNPSMSLFQVCADSNSKKADIHFAIHSNSGGGRGCECYCNTFGGEGEKIARATYNEIAKITPTTDRGVKEGHNFYGPGKSMYELCNTNAMAALIEIAFHDNAQDAEWIINNIEPIGIALAKGLLNYCGVPYVAPTQHSILYRVMAGSYADKTNALNQVNKLKALGIEAVIMEFNK